LIMGIGSISFFQWNSMPEWLSSVLLLIGGILLYAWVIVLGVFSLFGPASCSYALVRRHHTHPFVLLLFGVVTWAGILFINGIVSITIGGAACQMLAVSMR
jgi:hypothetical protein